MDDQLLLNIVGVILVEIDDYQPCGLLGGDLSANFGTDGTTAAGDDHSLPFYEIRNFGVVQCDRLSAQQFLRRNVANAFHKIANIGNLGQERQRFNRTIRFETLRKNSGTGLIGERRDGQVNHLSLYLFGNLLKGFYRAQNRQTVNFAIDLLLAVINESHWKQSAVFYSIDLSK